MTAVEAATPRIGPFPVVLPSLRDARLHTAAVILSVHAIGVTALGFRVSVPQILSAIIAAALVDLVLTLGQTGKLVWPASGMLTGSGVALILRLVEMPAGDYWTWRGWPYYAGIAGASVLTKHLIRRRGRHLFNPSNVGLVVAFLFLGRDVIEPLDFWWAPFDGWMALAYLVILTGGIVITRRLDLLPMAVTFWVVLAGALGVLAGAGHCMIATWAPEPVCDTAFWWVLMTSPEVLIFLLFMITDPKTIPGGRRARLLFSAGLATLATLLIAPQTTEYGAKVALLASLVVLTPLRPLFDRSVRDTPTGRMVTARRAFFRGAATGGGLVAVSLGIVVAGLPAREGFRALPVTPAPAVAIDPATLPEVTVDAAVSALNLEVEPSELAVTLAENLAVEAEAIREGNSSLLEGVATGSRLAEMQQSVDDAISTGIRPASSYSFDSLLLSVAETAQGQSSAALSFSAAGREETRTYDSFGTELSRRERPFRKTFVLQRVGGDRWLIAAAEG